MKQKRPYKGLIISLLIAAILYPLLNVIPIFDFNLFPYDVVSSLVAHDPMYRLVWYIQDFTNAQFYSSVLAGLGLLIGACIGYILDKREHPYSGFTITYIKGLFPWILTAQLLGLLVSNIYIPLLQSWDMGWVPTFIPFVSVPVIVIFVYGPSIQSVLTGSILSGLISTPIGSFIIKYILDPLGLPAVSANVFTMALVGIIVLEVCRMVPWMKNPKTDFYLEPATFNQKYDTPEKQIDTDHPLWFVRRVLADFTEAQFYGNEWASGLMLLGVILHFILDRNGVYYGNDFLPLLLSASIVGSATGIFLYHDSWKKGFVGTFTPIVTIIPGIILMVNGNMFYTYFSAILGGILAPALAQAINQHIPKGWHPMIGNTLSMSICTAIIAMIVLALPI